MKYKVTNISGGLLVCDLATKGNTLRLNNKQSETIKESEMTSHLRGLESKGKILCEEVTEPKVTKKTTVVKDSTKDKEE